MINIRSITLGIDWLKKNKQELITSTNNFIEKANRLFADENYKVRTTRLSLPTLNCELKITRAGANSIIRSISELCNEIGIRWFCVPISFFKNDNRKERYSTILEIARRYKNAFINLIVAENQEISFTGIADASRLVRDVSKLSNNGLDNFRIGISCNCHPHTPFFPFARHEGDDGFSIALETTGLFLKILVSKSKPVKLTELQQLLIDKLSERLRSVDEIGRKIEEITSVKYNGIDASLAPFPDGENSVGKIVELLGVREFGNHGTIFFTAFLTNIIKTAIDKSKIKPAGFNGVMYSLLEDDYLAQNNNHRSFTIDSILAYSTMCGCGLDMIPIPGNAFEEEIAALILDTATLSTKLNKPLGVRVLPIPMKSANEFTEFNYDFLVDTRVVGVKSKLHTKDIFTENVFSYSN